MTRWKLLVEYDGGPFVGWQRQDNGLSVQGALEKAVFDFCGERRTVHGAGRTDSGVHATGQVAHVDIEKPTRPDVVRDALNAWLRPQLAAVLAAEEAPEGFHARFSATGRRYVYRLVNRRAPLTVDSGRAWQVNIPLDVGAMREAAAVLVGHHDFSSFRSTDCQAPNPEKTLERFDVTRAGEEIRFEVAARSFLHNQVRIMVGTLKLVGQGKWTPADVARVLALRDRTQSGPTAPPDGLYLAEVRYDGGSSRATEEDEGE